MQYCVRCILPASRPGLTIGTDGVCSACRRHAERGAIDWEARRARFGTLCEEIRARGGEYDCVVPVSGGKDSTWQLLLCLQHELRPLAVSWRTPGRTSLGERNLRNLIGLGVDHIDFSINPEVERRFMRLAFERCGTPAIPMHLAIFAIPTTVAVRFDVPLVVWGENSAAEYVGSGPQADSFELTAAWIRDYGAVHGTTAADWVGDELSARELSPYRFPDDTELSARELRAVFLGMFFPWDPETTYRAARAHGFQASDSGPRTGLYDFADIDDDFISIHHYLKWHKYGFTRLWDNLSLEIRNGRLTRAEAVDRVRDAGDQTPHEDIASFCDFVERDVSWFLETSERFRDPRIWTRRDGRWTIDGFLVPDWHWEPARQPA